VKTLKMKYYLNFVSYIFLHPQTVSDMVMLLETKNILKKMNAYYQYIDAQDFTNSFNTWRPDGYIKEFFAGLRINFKVKEMSPSAVAQLPSRKIDMAGMVNVYAKNKMVVIKKSGNKKNELLYQLNKIIQYKDSAKEQMKSMERYFSMTRAKDFNDAGMMTDVTDVVALNDPKIYSNLSTLFRDITQTYKNQSINTLYEKIKEVKGGGTPTERLLKNFFNFEDKDKMTGGRVKQLDLLKNFLATATQAILPLADAYKSAIRMDNDELKRAKAASLRKEQNALSQQQADAARTIMDNATTILQEATTNKDETQAGGRKRVEGGAEEDGSNAIATTSNDLTGGGENELKFMKESLGAIGLALKDIPEVEREMRRAKSNITMSVTKLTSLLNAPAPAVPAPAAPGPAQVPGAEVPAGPAALGPAVPVPASAVPVQAGGGPNEEAIYKEAVKLEQNAKLLLNLFEKAKSEESVAKKTIDGLPNAFGGPGGPGGIFDSDAIKRLQKQVNDLEAWCERNKQPNGRPRTKRPFTRLWTEKIPSPIKSSFSSIFPNGSKPR
jgi:hypothetical protein